MTTIHTLIAARDAAWEAIRYRRIDANSDEARAARTAFVLAQHAVEQHPVMVAVIACCDGMTAVTVDALMAACRAEDGHGN